MEKVYQVEFMEYTNYLRDTVCNENKELGKGQYLHIGTEPFLVKESELEKYKEYGNGFRNVTFVGNINKEDK